MTTPEILSLLGDLLRENRFADATTTTCRCDAFTERGGCSHVDVQRAIAGGDAKCPLTNGQKAAIVGLGQMLLAVSHGDVFNIKTGVARSPREYVNEVLAEVGIGIQFLPPPEPRDPTALQVRGVAGEVLPGKVTRALEAATRRDPDKTVRAVAKRCWWKPAHRRGEGVEVRVVAGVQS